MNKKRFNLDDIIVLEIESGDLEIISLKKAIKNIKDFSFDESEQTWSYGSYREMSVGEYVSEENGERSLIGVYDRTNNSHLISMVSESRRNATEIYNSPLED